MESNYSFGSSKTLRIYGLYHHITFPFLFCSAQKEAKKAVENQMLRWFSMARAAIARDVDIC